MRRLRRLLGGRREVPVSGKAKLDARTLARIQELLKMYEAELNASAYTKDSKGNRRGHAQNFVGWLGGTWTPLQ